VGVQTSEERNENVAIYSHKMLYDNRLSKITLTNIFVQYSNVTFDDRTNYTFAEYFAVCHCSWQTARMYGATGTLSYGSLLLHGRFTALLARERPASRF
jgi:hypothetical protein